MSSQPTEEHEEDPMMNHYLLQFTDHRHEISTKISFDHHFDRDYAEAMNHHRHREHVASDHNLHDKTTSETAAGVTDGDHHQETRGRGRGKEVAAVVADDGHDHDHEHDERDHEEDGSSCAKKQEHNAKERLRRMKLHASYLALGTLLPDSPASKKKWSAPVIIDRALTCIAELQNEVAHLTLRKRQILTAIETGKRKKLSDKGKSTEQVSERAVPMVSVHDLGRDGEILVQICVKNGERNHQDGFGDLLHAIESQGMSILSSSSAALVSSHQHILSHHLHVKMQEGLCRGDYITVVREKIISSLT